jgi:hypothetical protein
MVFSICPGEFALNKIFESGLQFIKLPAFTSAAAGNR